MSLVGPRPVRPEISIALEREIPHYSDRLLVAPGITGLSQVLLPPDTDLGSARTKARLDAYYVRHAGPWLDARILIATLLVVLGFSGATVGRLLALPKPEVHADETLANV